ncbi:conserved hypothetical protein [Rippkaea orientalis PCC 8801]|uniref:Uncharacterized protein n=1 Tax=Rippkaea orientalis (strain PCC 8801 / RF-1) TaxID=41431 RepID=B7JXJ1_RIPO1|nr:hypothetical protein [Rippkaea orientalis]ACK64748.1 conserved hypothetical protein [Rippkaea orientalis PCC 8801]
MNTISFQEIIESIESLSLEDQDYLFDLIQKRRIDKRRLSILNNGEKTLKSLELGTAKKGSAEEIKAYLLEDEEE